MSQREEYKTGSQDSFTEGADTTPKQQNGKRNS